jgi:hypothetical protein
MPRVSVAKARTGGYAISGTRKIWEPRRTSIGASTLRSGSILNGQYTTMYACQIA